MRFTILIATSIGFVVCTWIAALALIVLLATALMPEGQCLTKPFRDKPIYAACIPSGAPIPATPRGNTP